MARHPWHPASHPHLLTDHWLRHLVHHLLHRPHGPRTPSHVGSKLTSWAHWHSVLQADHLLRWLKTWTTPMLHSLLLHLLHVLQLLLAQLLMLHPLLLQLMLLLHLLRHHRPLLLLLLLLDHLRASHLRNRMLHLHPLLLLHLLLLHLLLRLHHLLLHLLWHHLSWLSLLLLHHSLLLLLLLHHWVALWQLTLWHWYLRLEQVLNSTWRSSHWHRRWTLHPLHLGVHRIHRSCRGVGLDLDHSCKRGLRHGLCWQFGHSG